jgi:hypothetical protein
LKEGRTGGRKDIKDIEEGRKDIKEKYQGRISRIKGSEGGTEGRMEGLKG